LTLISEGFSINACSVYLDAYLIILNMLWYIVTFRWIFLLFWTTN